MKNLFHIVLFFILSITLSACQADKENPVILSRARFTVITPECIRLEYSKSGKFIDAPSLFAGKRHARSAAYTLQKTDKQLIIRTARLKLIYRKNGRPFSANNLEIFVNKGAQIVHWLPGMKNKKNLGGTLTTLDGIKQEVPLPPGLLTREGWFLLDDSKRPLLTENWVRPRPEAGETDWYFFGYGSDFKAALKALTTIGGPIPLPRKYALGSWYSRYWPYTSQEYRQIVREYKKYNFPLDVTVLDMDWHKDGWTGWSWNRKLLPDAEDLLKWFHKQNLRVTLNLHPADGVAPHEEIYQKFMHDMGVDVKTHPDSVIPFDAANQKYMSTLFNDALLPKEKEGVDFWWLDWQQTEFTRSIPALKNLEWLNRCFFKFSQKNGRRGLSFSRWGGWGDHRHPIHFSGDAFSRWSMLKFEVPFTSTAGNVGCFFWSHDIGGHQGGMNQEISTRWIQFGATTAALRLHSTRDPQMDKRPWLMDKMYTDAARIAFRLRSQLMPYIYSSAWQAVTNSIPLNRPMYIDYPQQEIAYQMPQQYFFGDLLLVAPIVRAGNGKKKVAPQWVWFPKGEWYNWFTDEKYSGGIGAKAVWADINEFPLFVKGGYPLPLQPYTPRMTSQLLDTLIIRAYPGLNGVRGSFMLYEDDGLTTNYTKGAFAQTELTYLKNGPKTVITIQPAKGKYEGQVRQRAYRFDLPCTLTADSVFINGQPVTTQYLAERKMNCITAPKQSIRKTLQLVFYGALANAEKIREKALRRRAEEIQNVKAEGQTQADNLLFYKSGIYFSKRGSKKIFLFKDQKAPAKGEIRISVIDSFNNRSKQIASKVFALKDGEIKIYQIKQPLLGEFGNTVTRILVLSYKYKNQRVRRRFIMDRKKSYLSKWKLLGPFDYDPSKNISAFAYAPEQEKQFDSANGYENKHGRTIHWQKVTADSLGIVDLYSLMEENNSLAYAFTGIESVNNQKAVLEINSDDGVEVFLNHRKVFSHHVFRAMESATDRVNLNLKKGENLLMLKISQGEGGWRFRANITATNKINGSQW